MASVAVQGFREAIVGQLKTPPDILHRGLVLEDGSAGVVLAPTGSILKDIRSGNYNLNPKLEYTFILPPSLVINGKSFAELEFLTYFNAYILGNISKGKPLEVVCTKEQEPFIRDYLKRTIEGPDWDNTSTYTFVPGEEREMLDKIKKYYAPKDQNGEIIPFEKYINFNTFNESGETIVPTSGINKVRIQQAKNKDGEVSGYQVIEDRVDGSSFHNSSLRVNYMLPENPLLPISDADKIDLANKRYGFAVSCFGNSTGFDPEAYTTSFVVWMGGNGLLIDPSEEALRALDELGISDTETPQVLLTHCHQDHDGGLLRKILQGKRINLIASKVVFEEFMIKADSLLSCQDSTAKISARDLIDWTELKVGEETNLKLPNGETAKLNAWWNIHPLPTNGFSIEYKGKTYGHSGDTQWGEKFLEKLVNENIITFEQAEEHRTRWFDQDGKPKFDLVHFEAGGPPIHTSIEELEQSVSSAFLDAIRVYHAPDSLIQGSIPKIKLYETQSIIDAREGDKLDSYKKNVKSHSYCELIDRKDGLLNSGAIREFRAGSRIISPEMGHLDSMFFILSGKVEILGADGEHIAFRYVGSVLGDWSHLTGTSPSAAVIAKSDVICMEIDLASDSSPITTLDERKKLREAARFLSQRTPVLGAALRRLGVSVVSMPNILLKMQRHMSDIELRPEEILIKKGEASDNIYFIAGGELTVYNSFNSRGDSFINNIATRGEGEIIGESALIPGRLRLASVKAGPSGAKVVAMNGAKFIEILNEYPGLMNALNLEFQSRM